VVESPDETAGLLNNELSVVVPSDTVGVEDDVVVMLVLVLVLVLGLPLPQPGYVAVVLDHVQFAEPPVPPVVPPVPPFRLSAPLNVPSQDHIHLDKHGLVSVLV
jgi:hypothetical protein